MNTASPRQANRGFLPAGMLTVFSGLTLLSAEVVSPTVKIEPRESDELLANPGMGWQTFHRFADDDPNLQGLPSASAYFRFYWREIEPQDGQIAFPKFDELLAHAHRAGQKLAFRIMCTGSGAYLDVPAWLKEQGCRGVEFSYSGGRHWVPDFADPLFQEKHFRLIRFIFDYALRCHASYVNNKSAPIPEGTRPEVERFLRRLGYRLVMRSVEHEAKASAGRAISVRIRWENTGVAPPYRDYRLAIRLRPSDGKAAPSDQVTETSIRGWLPGERRTELSLQLPPTLGVGRYELAVGVVDPRDRQPAVRLGNLGRDSDGWYPVSQVEVVP